MSGATRSPRATHHVGLDSRWHTAARAEVTRGRAAVVLVTAVALPLVAPVAGAAAEPTQHERTVTTVAVQGSFHCGDLSLRIVGGTETETVDTVVKGDVTRIRITRRWHGVALTGSDGGTYRAVSHVRATFVLVAPDLDNPVLGHEVVTARFIGGPRHHPAFLREEIVIRDGVVTDEVTGPCDFGP